MKNQIKFKIDIIRFDVYKGNIVTLIQFNSNSESQFEILTASEVVDKVTVVSSGHKGVVLLALPIKIDCNNLNELVIKLKKAGYEIIIKSEFERTLFQYVFDINLKTEFNIIKQHKLVINDFFNLSDKITFSFLITDKANFDSTINFLKLIRPHTKAKFNLYANDKLTYNDLCKLALAYPNVLQLGITIDKYCY